MLNQWGYKGSTQLTMTFLLDEARRGDECADCRVHLAVRISRTAQSRCSCRSPLEERSAVAARPFPSLSLIQSKTSSTSILCRERRAHNLITQSVLHLSFPSFSSSTTPQPRCRCPFSLSVLVGCNALAIRFGFSCPSTGLSLL